MGSSPESVRFLLQQLQCRPHTICWSQSRPVLLHRGHNHKLGFHFKTFSYPERWETVTVVVRVKEDCGVGAGGWLQVGDRILTVGAVPLTCLREEEVKHVFTCSQNPDVHLQVCAMAMSRATTDPNSQVKRFLSVNSGASGGSGTASVDSTERPKVKRFLKSNSTETPPPSPSTALPPSSSSSSSSSSATLPLLRCAGPGPKVELETPPPPPPSRRRQQAPRECATYKRPGYPLHSAPHLNPHHHSLPDRMEDDIILPDDIILCEADTPSSLPPVLTRLPNTPTPSSASFSSSLHSQYPGAAFVNTVSTGIGGESVVGSSSASSSASSQQQQRSLGVEVCRAPGCNAQRLCLWHRFVMMHPQFVIWEPFTKTVVLEKHHGKQASFGFKYKVKKHDGPPEEVFALVTEVTMGGLAWNLLLSGDWIRSLNGTPVNTAKEAFSPDFRSLSSLRLVIQRPEGLSWKGVPKLKALAQSSGISLHIPIPVPLEAASAAAPQPADNARPPPPPPPADHRSKYLDRHAALGSEEGGGSCRVGAREPNCQHRHRASFDDPLLEQYPRLGQSPGEHIPLNTLLYRPVPSWGGGQSAFPQARVVVCGAHGSAAAFVRGLVGDGVDLDSDAPVQSFQLSLQRGGGGGADADISVSSQRRQLTALINDWESLTCRAGEREGQGEGGRCMNLELHAISDEGFFHHCCPWLLPSCTLVIFTFHVHKLLNQPQAETRRLAAMVRSMQDASHPSEASALKILLYGMPSGPQRDVSAEEIQGMFYVTDSGSRLLERYGLAVNVTVPSCGRSMAATRREVFAACQDHLVQTAASSQCVVARVVDSLSAGGHWGVKVSGREVARVVVGEGGDAEMVRSVIGGLVETGSLLVCGSTSSSSSSNRPGKKPEEVGAEHQDYLLPFSAVQALASFLVKPLLDNHTPDSRQKWFKLITTARLTRAELAELLDSETSSSLSVEVLERLGVAFRLCSASPGARGDSGFGEDSAAAAAGGDFVLPYFLQDEEGGGGGEEGEREGGEGFVLRFERPLSWRGYFDMLCKLSALPATEEVVVPGHCRAGVRHNGLRLALHWRKDSGCDGVFVAVKRSSRSREGGQLLPELERLFSFVLPPAVPFKVQVAHCSSPSSHLPSRDGPSAPRSAAALHEEETFVKPVVPVEPEWRSLQMGDAACRDLPLTSLPWSVLNQAAILLSVGMPTGHDWRSVAELTGRSMVEIYAYEAISSGAREVPAMTFLREWMLTGKVQQFLDILETLERPDVRDLILNHLRDRAN